MLKIALVGSTGMLGIDINVALKGVNFLIKNYNSKNLDIVDASAVNSALSGFKPDYIINCAAYTNVDGAEAEKEKADAVNNIGVQNLAEAALNTGSRIIQLSTDYVFDGSKKTPYTEDDGTKPINEYGMSKLRGEEALKNSGASYIILRTSWLYGKNGKNFVNTILKLADGRKKIEVVDDQFGSPTYTKDVAYAISEIIIKDNSKNEIYNLTNEGYTSWYQFALWIASVFKRTNCEIVPVTSDRFARPAKRPTYSMLDNSKIKEDYNIELRPWKDALKKYCNDIGYFIV
jgi:dTDP-4-dehydrorhamnose reductase